MTDTLLVVFGALGGVAGTILVGFIGKVVFQIWNERRNTKVVETFGFRFDCFPKGLHRVLYQVAPTLPDDVWDDLPDDLKHLADNLRLYVFYLQATGSDTLNALKIMAHANEGSGIVGYMFNVEKLVVCDRLSVTKDEDKSVTAVWDYLNPGDFIELYLLATGDLGPADITIDVDGEGISIKETFPGHPVNLLSFKYPFVSVTNDVFLRAYVETWMAAASHGGHEQLLANHPDGADHHIPCSTDSSTLPASRNRPR